MARMLREGADPALLEVQIQKVQALRARRDYLCHRAEGGFARIAKRVEDHRVRPGVIAMCTDPLMYPRAAI